MKTDDLEKADIIAGIFIRNNVRKVLDREKFLGHLDYFEIKEWLHSIFTIIAIKEEIEFLESVFDYKDEK